LHDIVDLVSTVVLKCEPSNFWCPNLEYLFKVLNCLCDLISSVPVSQVGGGPSSIYLYMYLPFTGLAVIEY